MSGTKTTIKTPSSKKLKSGVTPQPEIEKIFQTEWFTLEALPFPPSKIPYYRLNCKDSVTIVPVTTEGKIILVRQFRPAIGMFTLEMPAGDIYAGESLDEAVQRELSEESGYRCKSLKYLGIYRVSPDRIYTQAHLYFGSGAQLVPNFQKEEGIETVLVTPQELEQMAVKGEFFTISGIALYSLAKMHGCFGKS